MWDIFLVVYFVKDSMLTSLRMQTCFWLCFATAGNTSAFAGYMLTPPIKNSWVHPWPLRPENLITDVNLPVKQGYRQSPPSCKIRKRELRRVLMESKVVDDGCLLVLYCMPKKQLLKYEIQKKFSSLNNHFSGFSLKNGARLIKPSTHRFNEH